MAENQAEDFVNHPPHYERNGKQCISEIKRLLTPEEYRGFLKGNAIKYIWRYPYKWDPPQDLNKAGWYVSKLIHDCPSVPYTPYQHAWSLKSFDARGQESQYVSAQENLENMIECGIEAIGHNDYLIADGWLNNMTEQLYLVDKMKQETKANQNAKEQKMADKRDDISDRMTPEELKANINAIFGAKAQTSTETKSTREDSRKFDILRAMKFLSKNYPDIWRNASWFNYDTDSRILRVKSYTQEYINGPTVLLDAQVRYVDVDEWKLTLESIPMDKSVTTIHAGK